MEWEVWNGGLSMAATVAFAITAVLAIRDDRDIDVFGATVLGLITAIGGGTMRDIILDVPVFWSRELSYVWAGTAASILTFYGRRLFAARFVFSAVLYLDGFGAALFGIQGAAKVWDLEFGLPAAPVILGVLTAIGGGLLRDVLANRDTLLMRPELYAVPVLLGCTAFVSILNLLPQYRIPGAVICIVATFAWRAAAIHWKLAMPLFSRTGGTEPADE
ncbi:trimeric intracellular cation channel family protein [Lignipirellula cremea]|uniref:Glycine transporter domain-containing protein n=1 Tax=Lignipirellula cremea TaxID=2528010 RepID=A0A518DQB5_9BACT|nr:TRIC cation channel family protein [Lignipirellula cremea]QDU94033.1 hypothetical protein Pla8534_18190 [Lignipirellula cremea]